jgi:hypothetical protein
LREFRAISAIGNTDEMAENALKILKDSTTLLKFKENALSVAKSLILKNILPLYVDLYEAIKKYSKRTSFEWRKKD